MKHFFSLILLLTLASNESVAKKFTPFTKNLSTEKEIKASHPITVSHRYGDIDISVWDKQAIKIDAEISGDLKDGEDLEALCKELMEGFIRVNEDVFIYVPVAQYKNNVIHLGSKKIKNAELTLTNGKRYEVSDLKLKLHVYMPDRHRLSIETRYHDLSMGSYNGEVSVSCDNGSFTAGNLSSGECRVSMKYGSVVIEKVPEIALNAYDGYVKVGRVDKLNMTSKYSTISIGSCDNASISSYDDDITVGDIRELSVSSKYTTFIGGNTDVVRADLYDGQFELKNVSRISINAKYTDIEMAVVGSLNMADSYDNNISLELVDQLLLNSSKYSSYRIGVISGSLTLDGYDDDFRVDLIASTAKNINMRIKYGDYALKFDKEYGHNIRVAATHGEVNYPKSFYTITSQNTSGSVSNLQATTVGYSGSNRVLIEAYSSDIDMGLK